MKIRSEHSSDFSSKPRNDELTNCLIKRLHSNKKALEWFSASGIREKTIRAFHLGLAKPKNDSYGIRRSDTLIAPVFDSNGTITKKSVFFNIPGVTINPRHDESWTNGSPALYYGGSFRQQPLAFVCSNVGEVWRLHQLLLENETDLNIFIFARTPGPNYPDEWEDPNYWHRFEQIFLGFENNAAGDDEALKIARISAGNTRRVRIPKELGSNWIEFFSNGGSVPHFHRLLSESTVTGTSTGSRETDNTRPGRFAYKPIDVGRTLHNGFLYYEVFSLYNSLETEFSGDESPTESQKSKRDTVFVRSDGTIQEVVEVPAPRGTPASERIYRLTDGTLVMGKPRASRYTTWDFENILKYCRGEGKARSLKLILRDVKKYLKRAVWLPNAEDYHLLTLLVPITFAQAIFQSVPQVLVTGPAGSGKSEVGRAMCNLCCNATIVGQASAATVARRIHETKGFVVLDDLESIVRVSKSDTPLLSELVQSLKLSYNQDTSKKVLTLAGGINGTEEINFFGVKMINNTRGVDRILGTRFLRIVTRHMPPEIGEEFIRRSNRDKKALDELRNELHTWTFMNVALIVETYKRLYPRFTGRASEISAPLFVFSEIAGDEELANGLNYFLKTQMEEARTAAEPIDLMMQAVAKLVRDGYRNLAVSHIVLEMKALARQNNFVFDDAEDRWHNPAWVGRHLRTYDLVERNAPEIRQNLHGLSFRIYPVKDNHVRKILNEKKIDQISPRKPIDFCESCLNCRYADLGCSFQKSRLKNSVA